MWRAQGIGHRGISLIEVTLVIVILALLIIAVARAYDITKWTKETSGEATVASLQEAALFYFAQNGSWPPDLATLESLVDPPPPSGWGSYDPNSGNAGS